MNNSNTTTIDDRLLYRRQYFIGPKIIEEFPNWNSYKIGKTFVTAHPDLEVSVSKSKNIQSALLGFAFDYENPQFSNSQILDSILEKSNTFEEFVKTTYQLSGRWIFLYSSDSEIKILNDPGGLRQVFYHNDGSELWCSAQPHTLADLLDLRRDDDPDIKKYLNSNLYAKWENSWIGDGTPYKDIHHLNPNHSIDLKTGEVERYWPNAEFSEIGIDDATSICKSILDGLFEAAFNRHDIALTVTSGWDTRVMLSLSKKYKYEIHYFVQKLPCVSNTHPDIDIPKQIFNKINLNFHIHNLEKSPAEFDNIYYQNVYSAQTENKKYHHYNYLNDFQGKLIITGNIGPLIRTMISPNITDINAIELARLMQRHNLQYAVKATQKWLDNNPEILTLPKEIVVKLFYWENHFGNWCPMFNAALDIAIEEFAPLNCRELLATTLSLVEKDRQYQPVAIYENIIKQSWPELMDFPFNPHLRRTKTIKKRFIDLSMYILKKIGLYNSSRKIYRKIYFR